MQTLHVARDAAEMPSASVVMRSWIASRMPSSKLRMVPRISTESGMMFSRTPPLIAPMVTTAGSRFRSSVRLTMVCRPSTICADVTMGPTPSQGAAPCVCLPCTVIFSLSELAIVGPGR